MPLDLEAMSATELAAAIQAKAISSVEATRAALDRLKPVHEKLNAVVTFEEQDALAAAQAADAALAKGRSLGPLHGVPLAHKDMFDRVGKIPSWGARIRREEPCTSDAGVIARLKGAGAIQIAALHLTEFAFGPTGHNYVIGHAKNPWDPTRITGGSSSGSAISVASGCVPAALGSDTAASLRVPAAACNITAIKPTWSRVSRAGAMPLSASLDAIGPLARDVRDLALVLKVIAGHDPADGSSSHKTVPDFPALLDRPVDGLRIGIDEDLVAGAHPDVQKRFETALKTLERAGCRRVSVRYPDWVLLDQIAQLLQLPEIASAHGRYIRQRSADYGPQVRARIEFGHFISAADHQTALRARGTLLARTLAETFGRCDVTMLPVLPDPLPTIAELDVGGAPNITAALGKIIKFTRPINYLGLPALSLPFAREGGLPNGFQIVGRPFDEARLLQIGFAYQRLVPPEIARVS
jgi:aspartyl-tRNA(Asn)/glutamyl-tRNA(Gln) amidotransferase subunit A